MILNPYGKIVDKEWRRTAMVRPNIELDAYIILPNHVHGIIIIHDTSVGAHCNVPLHNVPLLRKSKMFCILYFQYRLIFPRSPGKHLRPFEVLKMNAPAFPHFRRPV